MIKKTGTILGKIAGTITGEPIKFIGRKLNNDFIQDVGEGVKQATSHTGETLGSLGQGTWDTASGIIQKDTQKRNEGLKEINNTLKQTAVGIGHSVKNTYTNGKDVVQGVAHKDKEKIIKGTKGIGKTAAIATLAISVLDFMDVVDIGDEGIDHAQAATIDHSTVADLDHGDTIHIETRNDDLVGQHHTVSGVMFEEKEITLPSGEHIDGVFPDFESEYTVTIPQSMYLESDDTHFSYANHSLAEQINQDPELASDFTQSQLQQIYSNQTPDGFTWHHSEEPGKLELVDEEIHAETGHTGGRELWGGGTENR